MSKSQKVKTIHIGDKDIYHWTMFEGKDFIMPLLYKSIHQLIKEDLDELRACRVEAIIRGESKAFDFFVKKDELDDTIEKIMEWALQEERYDICSGIQELKTNI